MILPVGIRVTAFAAGALSTLNGLQQRLTSLGSVATQGAANNLSRFQRVGSEATGGLVRGFGEAESAWYKLGGALGIPFSLSGIWGAVSGLRSLKAAILDSNTSMETARVNMSARLRDYNDTKETAQLKARGVMASIQQYAAETPFDTQGLTQAAVSMSSFTKDPGTVMQALKLVGRVAAMHGDTDPSHAGQAFESAMNGNFTSLDQTFGIKANQDIINTMAGTLGYSGGTQRGKYEALKKLIEMRTGGADADPVGDLSKTGLGAWSTLQDNIGIMFQKGSEGGYDVAVTGLVKFNEAVAKFQGTAGYKDFFSFMQGNFLKGGQKIADTLGMIAGGLDKLPAIVEKYTPVATTVAKVAGGFVALNVAVLASKFAVGGSVLALKNALGLLTPAFGLLTNPLLLLTITALSAAMWPFAKGLEIGGKSMENWVKGAEKWSSGSGAIGFMDKIMQAANDLLSGKFLEGGTFNLSAFITEAFGEDSLVASVGRIGSNLGRAFRISLYSFFPDVGKKVEATLAWLGVARDGLVAFATDLYGKVTPAVTEFGKVAGPYLTQMHRDLVAFGADVKAQVTPVLKEFGKEAGPIRERLVALGTDLKARVTPALKEFAAVAVPGLRSLKDTIIPLLPLLGVLSGAAAGLGILSRLSGVLGPLGLGLQAFGVGAAPAIAALAGGLGALRTALGGGFSLLLTTLGSALTSVSNVMRGWFIALLAPGLSATVSGIAASLAALVPGLTALAAPALAIGVALLGSAVYDAGKHLEVGGKSIDAWMASAGKMSADTNWAGLFEKPMTALRRAAMGGASLLGVGGIKFDSYKFWQNLFAPDSLFSRLQGLVDPIWKGLMRSLDNAFPEVRGWFTTNLGSLVGDFENVARVITGVVIPAVTGLVQGFMSVVKVASNGWIGKLIGGLASIAWAGMRTAFEALANFVGNPATAKLIETMGKWIGVTAGALVGLKAAGALLTAGRAAATAGGPLGMAVATVILTAGAVSLYTNKILDNVRGSQLVMMVDPTGKSQGAGMQGVFSGLENGTKIKDETAASANGAVLGAFGAIIGRSGAIADKMSALVDPKWRKEYAASSQVGVNMMTDGRGRLQTLSPSLQGDDKLRSERLGTVEGKLKTLYAEFQKTGQLDEKNIARLTDEYMRGILYFNKQFGWGMLPENLKDGVDYASKNSFTKFLTGTGQGGNPGLIAQLTGQIANPSFGTEYTFDPNGVAPSVPLKVAPAPDGPVQPPTKGKGGTSSTPNVPGLTPQGGGADSSAAFDQYGNEIYMPSSFGGGEGGGVGAVTIHVPVTIYANQLETMDEAALGRVIQQTVTAQVPRLLYDAINGVRSS